MCTCSSTCNCPTVCGCAATYDAVCVRYNGADLPNIGAVTGDNLERILQGLDTVLLNIFTLLLDVPIGDNVGGGTELFIPTGANFRTFGNTASIEWALNGDLVEAVIAPSWIVANIDPIIADVLQNATDIGINEGAIAALESDVANLQTTIRGSATDGTDMGTYTGAAATIVPAAGSTKENIQALADYIADLGIGYTYIDPNSNLVDALFDLETAIAGAASGEAYRGYNR
jgi:hypothetical protein